jgi:uncharacterized membrane protein YdjX (TVP38/TMEM64 family)
VTPLQYLLILVFFKVVILFYILNYHFQGDIDNVIKHCKDNPMTLVLYFTVLYLAGAFVLFPVTIIMISSAFAYTHIWGILYGTIITVVHTYISCNIGFALVFLFGRYLLHDFVRHNVTDGDKRFEILRRITS